MGVKVSSNTENHLKSLDTYLDKLHNDANQPLWQKKESIGRRNRQKADNGPRLVEDYLGKLKVLIQLIYAIAYGFCCRGALASMNIAVFLFEIATPVKNSNFELFSLPLVYGAKINNLILSGEWWRLITPMFLHSGIFHIALGSWVLFTFGVEVSKVYGSFTFLLIYILGGISGNLISFLHTPYPTVGGTGPVFAVIGAWLIYQVQNKDVIAKNSSQRMFLKAIIATSLSSLLTNFTPIDEWTHFAAAVTGIAYGFVTCPTLEVKGASPEGDREKRITLVGRYADPCKSLVYFSFFILLLSSLVFIIEPPLDLIE
ncbi:hypothetical protein RD792_016948 [Penstemon davidsonii]|uniref:Peptidase S54 rhomboid domain-containing protein n=1 Tax=Penstemon davidsonii TaxID=160366 RepID=A0ABR0CLY0_9LAMI|nr:hypothetical protein RD792_016948 [Penstemon davidsonii]